MGTAARRYAAPLVLSAISAICFVVLQVPVGDLWAARARQSAAANGVPPDYWFSWFGGATPPGAYSLVTPYLSVLVGAATLAAIATVVSTALCALAVEGTPHPVAAVWAAAVVGGFDLWSGRVAFSVGTAFALGMIVSIRAGRWWPTVLLALVAVLSSPVVGVFVLIGLSGAVLLVRERRPIVLAAAGVVAAAMGVLALVFGSPGVEPIQASDIKLLMIALALLLIARPARYVVVPVLVSLMTFVVLYEVPNALGGNFNRMVWIWLPVAAIATARRNVIVAVAAAALAIGAGINNSLDDLRTAFSPAASTSQYAALLHALDSRPSVRQFRVETVPDGTHDAAYFLLGHALLARGYETQVDEQLNSVLWSSSLDAGTYQQWLDENAVGYVVLHRSVGYASYEGNLVRKGLPYLDRVWANRDWILYRVVEAMPIVQQPGRVVSAGQGRVVLATSRAGTLRIEVRWSSALEVTGPRGAGARLVPSGDGWTELIAGRAGQYVLSA